MCIPGLAFFTGVFQLPSGEKEKSEQSTSVIEKYLSIIPNPFPKQDLDHGPLSDSRDVRVLPERVWGTLKNIAILIAKYFLEWLSPRNRPNTDEAVDGFLKQQDGQPEGIINPADKLENLSAADQFSVAFLSGNPYINQSSNDILLDDTSINSVASSTSAEQEIGSAESVKHLATMTSSLVDDVNNVADRILEFRSAFTIAVDISSEQKATIGQLLEKYILEDESRDVGISSFCYEKENKALNDAIYAALREKYSARTKNSHVDIKALCSAVREDAEDELELSKTELEKISTSLLSQEDIGRFKQRCKVINLTINKFRSKLDEMGEAKLAKSHPLAIEILYRRSLNRALKSVNTNRETISNRATLMPLNRGKNKIEIREALNKKYQELDGLPCGHVAAGAKSKRILQRRLQGLHELRVDFSFSVKLRDFFKFTKFFF